MKSLKLTILVVLILILLGGLILPKIMEPHERAGQTVSLHNQSSSAPLQILCAPALRKPAEALFAAFTKTTGTKITVAYNASAVLLGQLKLHPQGNDVFMPADSYYNDQALKLKLVAKPALLCYLVPVIMTRKGNPLGITKLADLQRPSLRVGLADERSAAIGKVTADLLAKNHLSADNMHVIYHAGTIDELGNAIKLGTIDATVVWDTTAANYPNACQVIAIPPAQNIIVPVSLSVIAASQQQAAAQQFITFATSAAGQAILHKFSYRTSLSHQ